jgi:fibro-slime domain-containing protein
MRALGKSIWTAAIGAALLSQAPAALASSISNFSVQYFGIANQQGQAGNNPSVTETPDFYDSLAGVPGPTGLSTDYVTSTLGPNGLPVFNPSFTTVSGSVNALSSASLVGSTNQINWWSPASTLTGGNAYSTAFGTGTIGLSSTATTMSVPGYTGDASYFAVDILTGYFNIATAGNVQFSVGADDSAFVYVDGSLVDSIGGLNADAPANTNTVALAAGNHTVKIFYADRETPGGNLTFSVVTGTGLLNPTISASVPEPSTIALFGVGVLALYGFTRRTRVSKI